MSKRDIKKFLPPVYRTPEIDNFLDSTTNKLFEEKSSERVDYFIGRKSGGIYQHLYDPYAQERTKLREDYQLEPSLVERHEISGDTESVLFYQDILNNLKTSGSYTKDQNRLFNEEVYSYAPPIDYDMFVNFRDYFWVPEGAPSIELDAYPTDIIGKLTYTGLVHGTTEEIKLSTGNHVILSDGIEYIVDGVGNSITLHEFDLSNDKPLRVTRTFFTHTLDALELFGKEYITMERFAKDNNTWSRNNAWYHRDVLYPPVTSKRKVKIERERRATRPIIQFLRDIELFDYHADGIDSCDVYHDGVTLPTTEVDGVSVFAGMKAIKENSKKIYEYDGSTWNALRNSNSKVVVKDGRTSKSLELFWDGGWKIQQQKTSNTQPIIFKMYDTNIRGTENALPEGSTIFTYKEDPYGIFDDELRMTIEHRMSGDSSDYTFVNTIRQFADDLGNDDVTYKIFNDGTNVNDRLFVFTIGTDSRGNKKIFVNDNQQPNIVIESGLSYDFEYSDSSTTVDGWFDEYNSITIMDGSGNTVLTPTNAHSAQPRKTLSHTLPSGVSEETFYYRIEEDQDVYGIIKVVEKRNTLDYQLHNEFRYKGKQYSTIRQVLEIEEDGDAFMKMEYQPISDNFTVHLNGESVPSEFNKKRIKVSGVTRGQLLEVFYQTRESINDQSKISQEVFPSFAKNGMNDDPTEFSFSYVFSHFGSVISNQRFLTGSPLGINNYRDTGKDIRVGQDILKHTSPMVPLAFINGNENVSPLEAIEHSRTYYGQYKNNIILKTEEYMRDSEITVNNVRDVFNTIITDMNYSKQTTDSFNGSNMFASYRNGVDLAVKTNGLFAREITLERTQALYVYVKGSGIQTINHDYRLEFVDSENTFKIIPITFILDDIDTVQYYEITEPTYCPATPAKFGIFKPNKPRFEVDNTFVNAVLFVVGHDGSKTLAYTSMDLYDRGIYDGRDLVMLEFETRVYNGIDERFKTEDEFVIESMQFIPGKFRESAYSLEEYKELEYERFFYWATTNIADYTTNTTFVEDDEFTFNYSYNVDEDGQELSGHWKGIYEYYFDTTTPHLTPWEMLGFDIKPSWFDGEYGADYGSGNIHLWSDIEEGIIRHGKRKNTDLLAYLNDNPYRRIGLSSVLPVDASGKLLNPIEAGITTTPDPQNARKPWKFGDNAPVEQAWKTMSDYGYSRVILLYLLKPSDVVTALWDTEKSIGNSNMQNIKVFNYRLHLEDGTNVYGMTQWIYDLINSESLNPDVELYTPFRNVEVNLAHKVGGFINADELRLYAESYNPNSETLATLVPHEDTNIITFQSKDIQNVAYSGVAIERVEVSKAYYAHVDGYNYQEGDIIYIHEDDAYYRKSSSQSYEEWVTGKTYNIGDSVMYMDRVHVATQTHDSTNTTRPDNIAYWELKPFNSGEWAILIKPPKSSKSEFRIYGYDVRNPFFPISIPLYGSKKKSINVETSHSKVINSFPWEPDHFYKKGHIVVYGGIHYESRSDHRSASNFDTDLWIRWSNPPRTGDSRITYYTEGSGEVDLIEYGRRYKSIDDVVQFLADYGRELVNRGWVFDDYDNTVGTVKNWEFIIKEFVRWAADHKEIGSAITLSPFSDTANFIPKHGVVSLIEQFKKSAFNLLDFRSAIIPSELINVTRVNKRFSLHSPTPIYFLRLGIREYEHAITLQNETIFGDVMYDPIIGIRKDRLKMSGTKSLSWDGTLHAPGYIIAGNRMLPNFNTVSEELISVNDMDQVATKDVMNELKYHNIGYQKRQYLENLEMNDKSQINFYQGFIHQKGTTESFQRLLRSNVIDANQSMEVSEEWAIREATFGGNFNQLQVEFYISAEDFNFNPQRINLVYNGNDADESSVVTNIDVGDTEEWAMQPTRYQDDNTLWREIHPNYRFKTAGYVSYNDHELKSPNMKRLDEMMEDTDYELKKNLTAWIAVNELETNSWDVMVLDETDATISEIVNYGEDEKFNVVLKGYNINENDYYVLRYEENQETYVVNVMLKYLDGGDYVIMSHDEDKFISFSPSIELEDIEIFVWKSLRIVDDHENETIDDIDTHLAKEGIDAFDGMFVYRDSTIYDDGDWRVYQLNGSNWEVVNRPSTVVDTSLFNDVIAYDDNDETLEYVRPYDPIMGYIPGSLLHVVDIVSDTDPITYTDKEYVHDKYTQMEGTLWLDTNDMVYVDYYQGNYEYRDAHWGSLFPGCEVTVYEWIKSKVKPSEYKDGEALSNSKFITQQVFEANIGIYKTYYYFWVKNSTKLPDGHDRDVTANAISQSIKYPYNNGLPLLKVIDNYHLSVEDSSRRLVMSDVVLRINYQYQHSSVDSHTQWLLLAESSDNDDVPDFIFKKMIDSILGYDRNNNSIPFDTLSEINKYGNGIGQSWFMNVDEARKVFFQKLNEFLEPLNIWDIELFWERLYGGLNVDSDLISFIDWYHEDYDEEKVPSVNVTGRLSMILEILEDGDYVYVNEPPSIKPSKRNGGWTIYEYIEEDDTFKKVAESGATFRFDVDSMVNNGIPLNEVDNLRHIITAVFEYFAVRPYHEIINDILFTMIRLVMADQPNNNWLFPSTYITIRQELTNLVQRLMFRKDKEQEIIDYINEAKPYHTKIREFEKINVLEDEQVNIWMTDFDKPPYIDDFKNVFDLHERFIDKIVPDPDNGVKTFELEYGHRFNVKVFDGGDLVPEEQYEVRGRFIYFDYVPQKDKNYVQSIVVISDNIIHRSIIGEWERTKNGYEILDNTRNLDVWADLAINKDIELMFDRHAHNNTVSLERILEIYNDAYRIDDAPFIYIDSFSEPDTPDPDYYMREIDRVLIHHEINDLRKVLNRSEDMFAIGNETYFFELEGVVEDPIVFVNEELIHHHSYDVIVEGGNMTIRFKFELLHNDEVAVRPRKEWTRMMLRAGHHPGLNVPRTMPMFIPEHSDLTVMDTDNHHPVLVEYEDIVDVDNEVWVFEHDPDSDVVITSGTFDNDQKESPEENIELKVHETMVFMSLNRLPPLVKMGYDTFDYKSIQKTFAFEIESGKNDYMADITVPSDQVKVIVKDDVLIQSVDYIVYPDRIRLLRYQPIGESLVITDVYANFDPNYHNAVKSIKNINGGFDSYVFDYSKITEVPVTREFIVYDKNGRVFYFKANETNYWDVLDKPDFNSSEISITGVENDFHKRIFAIVGFNYDESGEKVDYEYEIIRGSVIDNTVCRLTRGLFAGETYDFSDLQEVRLYELHLEDDLENFVLQEQIVGQTGRESYPKYGMIFYGDDDDEWNGKYDLDWPDYD